MTLSTRNPRVSRKLLNIDDLCDFEISDKAALLFCLTKYLGKIEIISTKTLRPLRVFSLHTPETISHVFNKVKVHETSGTFCFLQANKIFQSRIFIANYKNGFSTSIPYEYSNSTKTITLMRDMLITAGSSSKIRFWDVHTGGFIDDISFSWNSVSISAIAPFEEKLVLVCTEETTSSLWLVSLQTKKIVKTLPLDPGQQIISAPIRQKIACVMPNQAAMRFWSIASKGSDVHDFQFSKKLVLNNHGSFLLMNQSEAEEDDLVIYSTHLGVKYQSISTNKVLANVPVNWSRKGFAKSAIKAPQGKRAGWVLVHDGSKLLLIA